VNERVLAHFLSDVGSVLRGCNDVDDTIGNTGLTTDVSHGEDGIRSLSGSLELNIERDPNSAYSRVQLDPKFTYNDSVSSSESSGDLSSDHSVGELTEMTFRVSSA
jgi:hypothetical protein